MLLAREAGARALLMYSHVYFVDVLVSCSLALLLLVLVLVVVVVVVARQAGWYTGGSTSTLSMSMSVVTGEPRSKHRA